MTTRNTHTTIVKLATELVIDGMLISEALNALAQCPKYAEHLEHNLFSAPAQAVYEEVRRRQNVAG